MDIPEPPEHGLCADGEEGFLTDPEMLRDQLPQPFRMIHKVLDRLLDRVWDSIVERESVRNMEKSKEKVPTLSLSGDTQLPQGTGCLACSDDGVFVAMGHAGGLSVGRAPALVCASTWLEDDGLEVTSVQMTNISPAAYLISTVDDMGVARVFVYHAERIHLIKVLNKMEDINQRSVCVTFELSRGGDYGAALFRCNGVVWLDIYHFPVESWQDGLETAASQTPNSSGCIEVKWAPVAAPIKIHSPKCPAGTTMTSPLDMLHKIECDSVAVSGLNHLISGRQWEEQDAMFRLKYGKELSPDKTQEGHCTVHFLLPCRQCPGLGQAADLPAAVPVAVCLWWSGSHNLFQYSLCSATKHKQDVDPQPAMLWPNAERILCSSVSAGTRYVALGLDAALVTVCDRESGLPLPVVHVSAADGVFTGVLFVESAPSSTRDSQVIHLVVTCRSGATHVVTTGRGAESRTVQLTERPKDSGGLPTVNAAVPFLQGLTLVVQRNGEMSLQDVINKTTVCYLVPPATHLLASPWNPTYALNAKLQTLFIRGDQQPDHNSSVSHLLVFHFGESAVVKPYVAAAPDDAQQEPKMSFANMEQACTLYLKQRLLSVGKRPQAANERWTQLQEHASVIQSQRRRKT